MAIYHHTTRMIGRSNGGNPTKALAYITGAQLYDKQTGEVFNFKDKSVEEVQILLPQDAPQWAKDLQKLVSEGKELDDRGLDYRDLGDQELNDRDFVDQRLDDGELDHQSPNPTVNHKNVRGRKVGVDSNGSSYIGIEDKQLHHGRGLNKRDKALQFLSEMANSAEKRLDGQVYREIEFSLPRELSFEQNKKLATEYVQDQFCGLGMLAIQSFHVEKCEKTGELNPHAHVFFLTRELTASGLSVKKNRDWNERSLHENWREQWAQYANFHLKMHGYDICLDHRSYKDQGIDIEPQVKLGKGVKEQEKRAKIKGHVGDVPLDCRHDLKQEFDLHSFKESTSELSSGQGHSSIDSPSVINTLPSTDRTQELRSIQLRNLYRIIRRPEVVLDIVSKHHATFMWGDVQKILGRYVDDVSLFQRLDLKLKQSRELITLKSDLEGKEVYTTRTLLKTEKSLVETAERLGRTKSHGVKESTLSQALSRANERLGPSQESSEESSQGTVGSISGDLSGGLSVDQQKAITHLSGEGQLKCVVGIAGAGKTTALGVCRELWEAEGYGVYGLAPTGKAAQNLEQSGIGSSTVHRFLKAFNEGRCQYSPQSVLVLDEAGMVDMERFERLLSAVERLGVKLIVVGDGAQLQPVEAGPAFRLITNRLGKAELNTVLRQKEEWQREATILFGSQKTKEAIQAYVDGGRVHIIEEKLTSQNLSSRAFPLLQNSLQAAIAKGNKEDVLNLYEVSSRTSSLMYREMMRDMEKEKDNAQAQPMDQGINQRINVSDRVQSHQDFRKYQEWKGIQKEAAKAILGEGKAYRPLLEERSLDPMKMAMVFVDRRKDRQDQNEEALSLLKAQGLESLIGIENRKRSRTPIDIRQHTKEALVKSWHGDFMSSLDRGFLNKGSLDKSSFNNKNFENPSQNKAFSEKTSLMLAFSNRDVNDLNHSARVLLKESGYLSKEEFTYTLSKMAEDDFGKKRTIREEKSFSEGDRIVFTKNNYGLGVKNGSIGTITSLDQKKVQVKLDGNENKEISFSPNLNPHFDHGWAITIHKSQGTTVDKAYLLASFEMTQNLAYVAMTRHREDVQVFGSNLDFWRKEKLPEVLSKSGEKLLASDYLKNRTPTLEGDALHQLMKREDHLLTRSFTRLGNELEAIGAVSKRAFWEVANRFLGKHAEPEIRVGPEFSLRSLREEERALEVIQSASENKEKDGGGITEIKQSTHKAFQDETPSHLKIMLNEEKNKINHTVKDVYEDWKHPAFRGADFYKRVFEEGLKVHGEEPSIQYWNEKRKPYMNLYEQKLDKVEKALESPLLTYMSDESRDLARKAALEDPDRTLDFLAQVKASKQARQEALEKAHPPSSSLSKDDFHKDGSLKEMSLKDPSLSSSPPPSSPWKQEGEALHHNGQGTISSYLKFKELHDEQQKSPYDPELKKELRELGKTIFNNKEMFGQIEGLDPKVSNLIKEKALEKTRELDRGRGGFSL